LAETQAAAHCLGRSQLAPRMVISSALSTEECSVEADYLQGLFRRQAAMMCGLGKITCKRSRLLLFGSSAS